MFQEFPKMIYKSDKEKIVANQEDLNQCLAEGWGFMPGHSDYSIQTEMRDSEEYKNKESTEPITIKRSVGRPRKAVK